LASEANCSFPVCCEETTGAAEKERRGDEGVDEALLLLFVLSEEAVDGDVLSMLSQSTDRMANTRECKEGGREENVSLVRMDGWMDRHKATNKKKQSDRSYREAVMVAVPLVKGRSVNTQL
jgi:hypothetical protein